MRHYAALTTVLIILVVVRILCLLPSRLRNAEDGENVMVLGTFHNQGWIDAHLQPLLASEKISKVTVIHDDNFLDHPKLKIHPPALNGRFYLAARLGKVYSFFRTAIKVRPTVYMGYSIMPNGLYALVLAKLFGGQSFYQMTGGPIEYDNGGYQNVNSLMSLMTKPSPLLEYLFRRVVRHFSHVIVRGGHAQRFLQRDVGQRVSILTGAISETRFKPAETKDLDLVHVSRLVPRKGILEFIDVVASIKRSNPAVRAAIIGDGPLAADIAHKISIEKLNKNIELPGRLNHPEDYVARSRLFLLLSESEGMSIALLEAMACGCVPVVTNVGELADAVTNETGVLLDSAIAANQLVPELLEDPARLAILAAAARKLILDNKTFSASSAFWNKLFTESKEGIRL